MCGAGLARPAGAASNGLAPIFECAFKNTDGSYVTVWGYDNETGATQSIAVGGQNQFTPGSKDQGQPTVFQTGRHDNVLVVPAWDGTANLKWHLGSANADAATTPACASNPVPLTGSGLSEFAAVGLLAGIGFVVSWLIRRQNGKAVTR